VNSGERRAARYYRLRGWRVIAANVRVGRDELDLIVRRGRLLRVVEVKEKRGTSFGDPLEMIDARKVAHVRRAMYAWLATRPELAGLEVGIEAFGVSPSGVSRVHVDPDHL
jgi:putative endonuclease